MGAGKAGPSGTLGFTQFSEETRAGAADAGSGAGVGKGADGATCIGADGISVSRGREALDEVFSKVGAGRLWAAAAISASVGSPGTRIGASSAVSSRFQEVARAVVGATVS